MPRVGPVPVHFAAAVHVAGHPSPAAPRTWTRCPPRACHNHYTTQCHSPPFIIVRDALGILTDLLKPFSRYPLSSLSTKYVCPCHTLTSPSSPLDTLPLLYPYPLDKTLLPYKPIVFQTHAPPPPQHTRVTKAPHIPSTPSTSPPCLARPLFIPPIPRASILHLPLRPGKT